MPEKICGLGFDCGLMMQCPSIKAENCLNWESCGARQQLTPEEHQEQIELVRVREEARELWLEENPRFRRSDLDVFQVSYQQAAMLVLMARGCTQTPESLGVTPMLSHLEDSLNVIRQSLEDLESQYIDPHAQNYGGGTSPKT
jgi:hypothetical protein